jgi:hypothetical protein
LGLAGIKGENLSGAESEAAAVVEGFDDGFQGDDGLDGKVAVVAVDAGEEGGLEEAGPVGKCDELHDTVGGGVAAVGDDESGDADRFAVELMLAAGEFGGGEEVLPGNVAAPEGERVEADREAEDFRLPAGAVFGSWLEGGREFGFEELRLFKSDLGIGGLTAP